MGRRALLALALLAAAGARPGAAAERTGTLAPGEVLRVPVPLDALRFVRATVHKDGADVDLRLLGPDGQEIAHSNTLV